MLIWARIAGSLAARRSCVLVSVAGAKGSAPREPGARMLVFADGTFHGTVGGGALEWQAIARARALFSAGAPGAELTRHVLGPELAQCCGGVVWLLLERFEPDRAAEARALAGTEAAGAFSVQATLREGRVERRVLGAGQTVRRGSSAPKVSGEPGGGAGARRHRDSPEAVLPGESFVERFGEERRALLLFGAGHVGRALVLALAPLAFRVRWIDSRENAFPGAAPGNVTTVCSADPGAEIEAAESGTFVLVMTHSHPLDLDIVARALAEPRFPYVGVIGSASKRARFASRLRAAGLATQQVERLVCPIGNAGIRSKVPAVIAATTVVELIAAEERERDCDRQRVADGGYSPLTRNGSTSNTPSTAAVGRS